MHVECDLVEVKMTTGAKIYFLSLYVLKAKYNIYVRLRNKTADHVTSEIIKALARKPKKHGLKAAELFKSLTFDNGSEFNRYQEIENALQIPVYFCRVGHPEERAEQENSHRMFRRYFFSKKKKTNKYIPFGIGYKISRYIARIARKSLDYITPCGISTKCGNDKTEIIIDFFKCNMDF
ncbi:DDE-type integrase/transposase/recombinase [Psittacicella hinzii]|uniref:Integrase catalytic domain-containing protein n=2 Tax=Psittacicella hinzii TaxID=2028575 RepID=A0A3A1YUE7_9GAMM|nr:DDE-type integrase/transposase/recombinase [Psittacicella hinzii]RIY40808.1 hypothetical protein CKF58_00065 [Psittacicella hinzii]